MAQCKARNSVRAFLAIRAASVLTLAACAMTAGPAMAEAAPEAFRMMVISDQAFGKAVMTGKHAEVISRLEGAEGRDMNEFEAANNLCVAYVQADDPENARVACDKAVRSSRHQPSRDRAIALSNRGVVLALTGHAVAALDDLRRAARLSGGLEEPASNLQTLTSRINRSIAAR